MTTCTEAQRYRQKPALPRWLAPLTLQTWQRTRWRMGYGLIPISAESLRRHPPPFQLEYFTEAEAKASAFRTAHPLGISAAESSDIEKYKK